MSTSIRFPDLPEGAGLGVTGLGNGVGLRYFVIFLLRLSTRIFSKFMARTQNINPSNWKCVKGEVVD